jgi:hypothetical protein
LCGGGVCVDRGKDYVERRQGEGCIGQCVSVDEGLGEVMYVHVILHNRLLNSGYRYSSQEKELCYVLSNFEVRRGAYLVFILYRDLLCSMLHCSFTQVHTKTEASYQSLVISINFNVSK